jgi:hypothetical protein
MAQFILKAAPQTDTVQIGVHVCIKEHKKAQTKSTLEHQFHLCLLCRIALPVPFHFHSICFGIAAVFFVSVTVIRATACLG